MTQIFIITFVFTIFLSWILLRVFPKLGFLDRPAKYGLTRSPIPYPGGVAIYFAFLFVFVFFLPHDSKMLALFSAATFLAVVCFIDDRIGLSPIFRLLVHLFCGLFLVWGGIGISSISNPFGGSISLGILATTFTVLWVMVMINSFNWVDGVPGMVSSISFVSALILFLLSNRAGFHYLDQSLAINLSLLIMAVSLGFFIFDFPPPRMIMGDTGSMLLGLLIAVTAIISGGKIATTILVLSFPILDFVWVILRRFYKKQSPFRGDLTHFHHKLLKAGLSERKVILFYSACGLLFGFTALLLHTEGKIITFGLVFALMVVLAILLYRKK